MFRLFISLYLVIVVGIISINYSTEYLWRVFTENTKEDFAEHKEQSQLKSIIKTLPTLLNDQAQKVYFKEHSGLIFSEFPFTDIAWLAAQKKSLLNHEVVTSFSDDNQLLFYVLASDGANVYQIKATIIQSTDNYLLKYTLLCFSYLLLAFCILLWSKPIWRDLLQIQNITQEIEKGNLNIDYNVSKHSPTVVIVQTFQQLTLRITDLLKEQKHLVNAVSHELRTPLSRLRFSAAMMDNIQPQQLEEITTDIKEMEKLVDEMLDYSRIENIDKQQDKTNVNITELLNNVVAKYQRSTDKNISIFSPKQPKLALKSLSDVSLPNEDIHFYCNGHLIERACQNLIGNAVKHACEKIIIEVAFNDTELKLSVSDDGKGIDAQYTDAIFQPFFKLDKSRNKSTNKNQDGVGLGLAIVKRIMAIHQGECTYQQVEPVGARFILSLPNLNPNLE